MKRNVVKLLSLFIGLVLALCGLASQNWTMSITTVTRLYPYMYGGVAFWSVALIMHSKDIRAKRPVLSDLLRFLAYFWLFCFGLGLIATVAVRIFLGFWIFQQ